MNIAGSNIVAADAIHRPHPCLNHNQSMPILPPPANATIVAVVTGTTPADQPSVVVIVIVVNLHWVIVVNYSYQ